VNPIDAMTGRICTTCGLFKPLTEFSRSQSGKYGRRSSCKVCLLAASKAYFRRRRANAPERASAVWTRWANKNRQYLRARAREYMRKRRTDHPERTQAETQRWRKKYPDRKSASEKRWRQGNAEHCRRVAAIWRMLNPEVVRAGRHRRRARDQQAIGTYSRIDVTRIYRAQRGHCAYFFFCSSALGNSYHIDHIVPLARGGSNAASNIQLTCPSCNTRKQALDPIRFARKIGALL
jgi:5-methylcytosine-specific restriction endonuclease McrA